MANQFLNLQEIQLTSEQKYNGNFLKVFSDSVKLPNRSEEHTSELQSQR